MSQQVIPEWVATLVGRLTLENENMRLALAQQPPDEAALEAALAEIIAPVMTEFDRTQPLSSQLVVLAARHKRLADDAPDTEALRAAGEAVAPTRSEREKRPCSGCGQDGYFAQGHCINCGCPTP